MMKDLLRRSALVLSMLSCVALAVPTTAVAAGSRVPHWTRPVSIDPDGRGFLEVSCPTSTFCIAVDYVGKYLTFDGTTWSSPQNIAPKVWTSAVSCPTATFCMAATSAGSSAEAYTFDGTAWSDAGAIPNLVYAITGLSCPTVSFCEVLDGLANSAEYVAGTWSGTGKAKLPPSAGHLSCGAASFCLAGAYPGAVSVFRKHGWAANGRPFNDQYLTGISCTSRSYCLAIGNVGEASVYDGTGWTTFNSIRASLTDVSCVRPGLCVAIDGSSSYTLRRATWGAPIPVPHEQGVDMMRGISCVPGLFCAAVDKRGRAAIYQ